MTDQGDTIPGKLLAGSRLSWLHSQSVTGSGSHLTVQTHGLSANLGRIFHDVESYDDASRQIDR